MWDDKMHMWWDEVWWMTQALWRSIRLLLTSGWSERRSCTSEPQFTAGNWYCGKWAMNRGRPTINSNSVLNNIPEYLIFFCYLCQQRYIKKGIQEVFVRIYKKVKILSGKWGYIIQRVTTIGFCLFVPWVYFYNTHTGSYPITIRLLLNHYVPVDHSPE